MSYRYRAPVKKSNNGLLVFAVLVIIAILVGGFLLIKDYNTSHTAVCTVKNTETVTVVSNGNSHTEKRVATDCGVFTADDSFVRGKTRSADLFYSLEKGKRYEFKYNGWRIGLTSSFPNITEAKEVK